MSYYLVKCKTALYNKELLVCLTKMQLDKLKYKIQHNLITHKILISDGSDSENVNIIISDQLVLTKYTYDQIKEFIGNYDLISNITNKTKLHFWYSKMKHSAIVDDFIRNKLNKLEHDEFDFRFEECENGSIYICQKHGKVIFSNNKMKSISGIDLSNNDIIDFLIKTNKN